LVLALVELLRQLMERQALRRVAQGSVTDEQVEKIGLTLMALEERMTELREHFGLTPEDLNIDLGPLGPLLSSDLSVSYLPPVADYQPYANHDTAEKQHDTEQHPQDKPRSHRRANSTDHRRGSRPQRSFEAFRHALNTCPHHVFLRAVRT
jgi:hypothetical protein